MVEMLRFRLRVQIVPCRAVPCEVTQQILMASGEDRYGAASANISLKLARRDSAQRWRRPPLDGAPRRPLGPAYHRLPEGVGTNGAFTEGPHISYMLS